MKKLINTNDCKLKGYFTNKFRNESTKDLEIATQLSNLINEKEIEDLKVMSMNRQYLIENIPASYFTLSYERELNIDLIASSLALAIGYLDNHYTFVRKNALMYLVKNNYTAKKKVDFILRDKNNNLIFVIISKGKQRFTKTLKTKNSIANFEYYLYYLAAKEYANAHNLQGNITMMNLCLTPDKKQVWTSEETIRTVDFEKEIDTNIVQELETQYLQVLSKLDKNPEPNIGCNGCMFCQYSVICNYLQKNKFSTNSLKPVPQEVHKNKDLMLTDNQRKLTEAKSGIFRTLASAGSGKTTTLAGIRTCNLISYYGYKPEDFLFLTFSERGVREIKEKINYWSAYFNMHLKENSFKIFTFNGFGQKIIDDNYKLLGFDKKPKLILRSEKLDLIASALSQVPPIPHLNYMKPNMEMFNAKGVIIFVEEYINWLTKYSNDSNYLDIMREFRDNQRSKIHLDEGENIDDIHKQIYKVYKIFDSLKKERAYIEYDDQIRYALQLLSNPQIAKKYSAPHLVVDEFQDTDEVQMQIIQKLIEVKGFESFVACGDDSQSIFSWRGATSDNIINFDKYFAKYGKINDIQLVDNFRCNSDITEFSNKLNDLNTSKYDKVVKAYKQGNGNSIHLSLDCSNENDEIKRTINRLVKSGYKLQDIAIIARTNLELTNVSSFLEEQNIPYNLVVVQKLIEIPEVRGLLSFGKYIYYPQNYLYFSEFYQTVTSKSLLDFDYDTLIKEEDVLKSQLDAMSDEELLQYFKDVVECHASINNGTRTFAKLVKEQDFQDIYDLASWLNSFIDYNENLPVDKDLKQYEAVTLMTAHSCKGSEFKAVIVLLDKFNGNAQTVESLDEERRSLFVAITRAKDSLDILKTSGKRNGFVDELISIL